MSLLPNCSSLRHLVSFYTRVLSESCLIIMLLIGVEIVNVSKPFICGE